MLEDEARQLDIDQLLERADSLLWQPLRQEVANFGFTDSTWWLRVRLKSEARAPVRRLFELSSPLLDYIDAYAVDEQRQILQQWETGGRRLFSSRPIQHHTFEQPIHCEPGASREVFVRFSSHDELLLPATPLGLG